VIKASVYDWDQVGTDELIGMGTIRFSGDVLESFAAKDLEIPLEGGGKLKVRLLWQPQLLARKRTGTSLFSATTRIFTHAPGNALGAGKTFAGAGIGAGGKVIGAGGKALGSGFEAIGGGIRSIGKFGSSHLKKEEAPVPVATTSTTSSANGHSGTPEPQRFSTSTRSSNDRPDSSSISNEGKNAFCL
jgi:Ca2+-dependent lipid-binding protein